MGQEWFFLVVKAEGETGETLWGPGRAKVGEGHFAAEKGISHYSLSPMGLSPFSCSADEGLTCSLSPLSTMQRDQDGCGVSLQKANSPKGNPSQPTFVEHILLLGIMFFLWRVVQFLVLGSF